jgi:membrane dipeptidase
MAEALHERAIVVDGHNHIQIELRKKRYMGQKAVFSREWAPLIRQGGVNVLVLVVGGDSTSLTAGSDLMLWGTLENLDMMWLEAEESCDAITICQTAADIDKALGEDKIALILALEGGRPLEGKPTLDTLNPLRNFYRLGVRHVQLVDCGRNRLGDTVGNDQPQGGLTPFGIGVVLECNRLGVVIDVAHLNDRGCWDVIETTEDPIVDSHSGARAVSDHPRMLTDDRIKAMAQNGGVIGLSCYDTHVNAAKVGQGIRPTLDDLLRHVDHIADVAGIDHVGIGPDHFLDHSFNPAPGWMEGIYIGLRDHYHVEGLEDITQFPMLTDALVNHGYSDDQVYKILGRNLLRVYREVLS